MIVSKGLVGAAAAALLVLPSAAQAGLVTSLPGGEAITMPTLNAFTAGPLTFGTPSATFTSQNAGSVFGYDGFYGFQ